MDSGAANCMIRPHTRSNPASGKAQGQPDRVVRRRLAKWLMRGPFTASLVLGATTLIRRTGDFLSLPDLVAIPIAMVVIILTLEHGITMLMVTHEADIAAYASRVVHFIDGQIAHDKQNEGTA